MTTINAMTYVASTEVDLIKTAQIKAINDGKPVYIARMPTGQFCITSYVPHSMPWKKEKLEWRRTILPNEGK